jgi:rhodanese-related sulfurtransferase
MQQFIEFAVNHWMLFLALLTISGVLVYNLTLGAPKDQLEPQSATELINHRNALVVDVRPVADFSQGHIINAVNLPMNGFQNQIGQLKKHQGHPIIVSCRSGAQSSQACRQLRGAGFGEVYNLRGGMLAWQNANLPITRKK